MLMHGCEYDKTLVICIVEPMLLHVTMSIIVTLWIRVPSVSVVSDSKTKNFVYSISSTPRKNGMQKLMKSLSKWTLIMC